MEKQKQNVDTYPCYINLVKAIVNKAVIDYSRDKMKDIEFYEFIVGYKWINYIYDDDQFLMSSVKNIRSRLSILDAQDDRRKLHPTHPSR